jgi:DNA-binding NtrC family response regulator
MKSLHFNSKKDKEKKGAPESVEDIALRNLRLNVLEICNGNRSQAAEVLGTDLRRFRANLARYKNQGHELPQANVRNRAITLPRSFWEKLAEWMKGVMK